MQLYSGEDSLVDSFPHALEKMEGARRYISAFQAPLQELSPAQVHALRACSLLVMPPPKEGGPPPGGFPKDLSDLGPGCHLRTDGAAAHPGQQSEFCGHSPTRPAREGNRVGVLPLLLPLGLPVYLQGSLPSIMEPGSRGVAGVRSDYLLRRPDHSWYACSRVPTTPTRPPSHRLQQMEAAASQGPQQLEEPQPHFTSLG